MHLLSTDEKGAPASASTEPSLEGRGIAAFFKTAPRWEVVLVCTLFALVVALKLAYVGGWRIDSDEPQHLHVVWGWARGEVQYRDFFDNHAPLFQLLMAPVMKALGERADILFWMRLAMVPFFVASLACLGVLGRRLFRPGFVPWAVLIAAVFPVFLLTSTEFRTDILWMLGWFAWLALFFGGELTPRRWFMSGLLLGATLCVSMKTSLLLGSLLMAALPVLLWRGRREGFGFLQGVGPRLLAGAGGALLVPLVLVLCFAAAGALSELYYCVFEHNIIAGHGRRLHWTFLGRVGLSGVFGALIYALSPSHAVATRRTILFVSTLLYLGLLHGYWPLITEQDYLPVVPVLILIAVLSGAEAAMRLPVLSPRHRRGVAKAACLIAFAGIVLSGVAENNPLALNHARLFEDGLARLLKLAGPNDYLLDPKGETIFRKRPFYYVLEGVTHRRIKNGLLQDTVREDVVRTNTSVIFFNKRIPKQHKAWLHAEYVQVAHEIWVAGAIVPAGADERRFTLARPALYCIMNAGGATTGLIDGQPCRGPVHLEAGEHTINAGEEVAVVWAKTAEAGLNPFTTQELVCTLVNDEL